MALVSPGTEVTIVDQSQYVSTAANSVPLIILATANNKADPTGTHTVAPGTLSANANTLYQVSSQRDLVSLFGNPFFYKTSTGTPIHGYELNEYGLLAAYSLLGSTNSCYILRADLDLNALVGAVSRPLGAPTDGTYWLDTSTSTWGIYEFDAVAGQFVSVTPAFVITSTTDLTGGAPNTILGNIGDYAVVSVLGEPSTYYYKTFNNAWVAVGSKAWIASVPTITGTGTTPITTPSGTLTIQLNGGVTQSLTIAAASNVGTIEAQINALGIEDLIATVMNGQLSVTLTTDLELTAPNSITIGGSDGVLTVLGISAGTYYAPTMVYGTSAQMPLWSTSQTYPRPSGSVWIKTSAAGNGLNLSLLEYKTTSGSFKSQSVNLYPNEMAVNTNLDATGGQLIPAGTVYAQYSNNYNNTAYNFPNLVAPITVWERLTTGPTTVTGTITNPTIPSGKVLNIQVSVPGSSMMSSVYSITTTSVLASDFVTAWIGANIPYTAATLNANGTVSLTHTVGGEIFLSDNTGIHNASVGIISALGIVAGTTVGTKESAIQSFTYPTATTNFGVTLSITTYGSQVVVNSINNTGISGTPIVGSTYITVDGVQVGGVSGANNLVFVVTSTLNSGVNIGSVALHSGVAPIVTMTQLTNWVPVDYIPSLGQPAQNPADGTSWFYSDPTQVDIMVNKNGVWKGYRNVNYDLNGHPSTSGSNGTDPNGPILTATVPPTTQSTGANLVYGDLWIDTSDLENYPMLYRWQNVDSVAQWVKIDTTDHVSSSGIVFADARWNISGAYDPVNDPIPTINSMLTSDYIDLDCPNPELFPQGTLLFNTRRSGYTVKEFKAQYFNGATFPNAGAYNIGSPTTITNLPLYSYTWVTVSGNQINGAAYMGRKAQRVMVVDALKAAINTNTTILEEDTFFNLIATPGYPELQPDMVTLNNNRNNTGYIIGDTPLRLNDQVGDLTTWATNAKSALSTGEDGLVTHDSYLGVFYPSGITSDLTGADAVVPASHMMLTTFLYNDSIAYPWLAAAGTRRGLVQNVTNIGYLDAQTGQFVVVKNRQGVRDVLYANMINPITFFSGIGLLNYGNKNTFESNTSLDRTNVARLVAYIRYKLQNATRPFVFEPNDNITRNSVAAVIQTLFIDLVAKRGLYDFAVVCDTSNNTPATIDANELWVDIAIEPVIAAEFIYIPVRILATGALAAR